MSAQTDATAEPREEFDEWQHRYRSTRAMLTGEYKGCTFHVTAGLHWLRGNSRPYFSVTCDVYEGKRDVAGGCMHREIAKLWPGLAPVIALHLSTDKGEPMHAEGNAWYQLAGYYGGAGQRYHAGNSERQHWNADGTFNGYRYSTPEECLASWAEHVRISIGEARSIADGWQHTADLDPASVRRWHAQWIGQQAERWAEEARAAIATLDLMNAQQAERKAAKEARA